MCRYIETIRFLNGEMPLLDYHQSRFEKTQIAAFGKVIHPSLKKFISEQPFRRESLPGILYKCRVVYDDRSLDLTCAPYRSRKISRIRIVYANDIDYHFKFEDRTCLEKLKTGLNDETEVLVVRNNLLTDTTFTNIALYNGTKWLTPAEPLLEGVQRKFLLQKKLIFPEEIRLNDLKHFQKIKLFNAMISWEEAPELNISRLSTDYLLIG